MGRPIERFPLFPLGLVLLPGRDGAAAHLRGALQADDRRVPRREREFGIVWLADDGLHDTGCAAPITQVLERMEDGRMNILAEGTRPFRLRGGSTTCRIRPATSSCSTPSRPTTRRPRPRRAAGVRRPRRARHRHRPERGRRWWSSTPTEWPRRWTSRRREAGAARAALGGRRMAAVRDLFTEAMRRVDEAERAADRASRTAARPALSQGGAAQQMARGLSWER